MHGLKYYPTDENIYVKERNKYPAFFEEI